MNTSTKSDSVKILDHKQIGQKINRLAFEILEQNYDEDLIVFAGINTNGMAFANIIAGEFKQISDKPFKLTRIRLNPANPISEEVILETPVDEVEGRVVIIVDDVANTGRTMFYAIKPLLSVIPKKIETAVLVDRQHKSFPIQVDYVGLSLATTFKENIDVQLKDKKDFSVYLR